MDKRKNIESWYLKKSKGQGAVPSVRRCATELGVSTRTVYLVVQALKARGLLESLPGEALYAAGFLPTLTSVATVQRRNSCAEIFAQIQKDLRTGKLWLDGLLPSAKMLAQQYQVSQPTLRKVLSQLCQENILERKGVHYQLAGLPRKVNSHRTIRLLVAANEKGLRLETPREIEFLRYLLDEARAMGLRVEVVGVNDYGMSSEYFYSNGMRRSTGLLAAECLGTVLSTWHLRDAWNPIGVLQKEKLPISVWMEGGKQDAMAKRFGRRSESAFFDVGYGLAPGRVVGKFLASKEHNACAYISPFHGSEWSKQRLKGLAQVCRTEKIQLFEFVLADATDPWTYRNRVVQGRNYMPQHSDPLTDLRIDLKRNRLIAQALEPLFQKALRSPQITVWVLANDLVAYAAQDFLAKHRSLIRMPIELVSFDNEPSTYARGISSYEFNTRGMVLDMLYHIVAPKSPLFEKPGVIHLDGRVVEK